jgi:hypothetical protein
MENADKNSENCIISCFRVTFELGNSVSIEISYGLGDRGSIPDRGRGFLL